MCKRFFTVLAATAMLAALSAPGAAGAPVGTVVDAQLESRLLRDNLVGIDPRRRFKVYLPPGYSKGAQRYPVIFYFHNMHWSPRKVFEDDRLHDFQDRAPAQRRLGPVIVVAGDFTTPTGINVFSNNSVAGRWIEHIVDELVPYVDANFRTLATPASRGLAGHFFGGFAALKLAMLHAREFGSVYALHPVGSGTGLQPGRWRPDWRTIHAARNWQDLQQDTYGPIFVAMFQAYLPNAGREPFFCDFTVEPRDGQLRPDARNIARFNGAFHLDQLLESHAEALKGLRAIKLDWGRYDPTPGHVYANQALTRKLEEYGVKHFAEEYAGNEWDQLWVPHGRVEMDLLPFFAQFLEGAAPRS